MKQLSKRFRFLGSITLLVGSLLPLPHLFFICICQPFDVREAEEPSAYLFCNQQVGNAPKYVENRNKEHIKQPANQHPNPFLSIG